MDTTTNARAMRPNIILVVVEGSVYSYPALRLDVATGSSFDRSHVGGLNWLTSPIVGLVVRTSSSTE